MFNTSKCAAIVASCLALVTQWAAAATPETYYAFVFNGPNPGQEAEYNRWYNEEHAPDVVSVPGFMTAQRFKLSPVQMRANADDKAPPYLVLYKIVTDDLSAVYAEVNRRAGNGQTRMSSTMARGGGMNVTYRLTTPERAASKKKGAQTFYHIVFSDSKPGEEAALDQWYVKSHGPDMNKLPGSMGYWFGTLSSVQMTPETKFQGHASVFHIEANDMTATSAAFAKTVGSMAPGPAMSNVWGYTYQAIGPEFSGDTIRAERAAATAGKK
ncbi:MAG: hypothetical protein QM808_00360 [Steroidobacteraceae bacterium]